MNWMQFNILGQNFFAICDLIISEWKLFQSKSYTAFFSVWAVLVYFLYI